MHGSEEIETKEEKTMRRTLYLLSAGIVAGSIFLIAYSPDPLSMAISGIMLVLVLAGLIFEIFPLISVSGGLQRGSASIENAPNGQSLSGYDPMFGQKMLDSMFEDFRDSTLEREKSGRLPGDMEDHINEDSIGLRCWTGVAAQIPGTLTGLGILGTFIGLITGISEIGFSSVDAALTSVQTLLNGIHVAFYTSIAGVILSILFNILHRITWNVTVRQLDMFTELFHLSVMPSTAETEKIEERKYRQTVLDRLDRIPKTPGFSISDIRGTAGAAGAGAQKNAQILMPQIIEGLKKKEFIFVLQPKYNLGTGKMTSAEAYIRWNHEKLGMVSPAVFLPVVEENGYITKLDEYMWESVFRSVREWIDGGLRIVPIALNVSKTDILAGDVISSFETLMTKYKLPPRQIEIEIAQNAFTDAPEVTTEVAATLRQKGFKVIVDGFDGNYVPFSTIRNMDVDEVKFDMRRFDLKQDENFIRDVFSQGKNHPFEVTVEGVESMEQVSALRKYGCATAQGFYFSKPVSKEEFIGMGS